VIEVVHEATAEVHEALRRLVPQLSQSARPLSENELDSLIRSDAVRVLVARDAARRIVGTLTLAVFPLPTGMRAWIEDVVVDENVRGHGVGESLTAAALDIARREGAITVDLTSRPSREGANRLYQRIGFEQRETNVYCYRL
jgi:ribosomal protein S18 acetylase RimI-like enzyme